MKKLFLILSCALLVLSCQRNPFKVDLSDTTIDFQYANFGGDLFAAEDHLPAMLPALEKKYPQILPLFTTQVIAIGNPRDDGFARMLESFVQDSLMNEVKYKVDSTFDQEKLKAGLYESFRYYHYYFPKRIVPKVFTCISGFNQSIIMTDSLMGIGLDKYLGRDCLYYPRLGIPHYQFVNMHPSKIIPDAMYAWGMSEFPFDGYGPHLIERMVYEGKLLYFLDAMLPGTPDSLKIGFSQKQLDFCAAKENAMWTYLAEYKLLFSTERMDVKRYVDDAPYTSGFTAESPGRTGAWLGWQIVKSYMQKHPDVSLPDLMNDKDGKTILNQSGYQP